MLLAAAGLAVVLVTAVLVVLGVQRSADPAAIGPVVQTDRGAVRGVRDGDVRAWRGIPYAAPPVGPLRWREPEPAAAWSGVRDGSDPGPSCLQPSLEDPARIAPGTSEDCLALSVVRPDDDRTDLPVLVWIHGGAFVTGSGTAFDTSGMAARGVVVVSPNYRLGVLGFFAHPALDSDVANFGLLDQLAALRWVRDNVEAFGGDPDRVTLVGSSAGAMSVNALLTMPATEGLVAGAISQSALGDSRVRTLARTEAAAARRFPDRTAEQLRSMPAEDLLTPTLDVFAGEAPVLDSVLTEPAVEAFEDGRALAVPYVVGSTDLEFPGARPSLLGSFAGVTRAQRSGRQAQRVRRAYGAAYEKHVGSDVMLSLPALRLAVGHSGQAPTYRYRYAADPGGSRHSADVGAVFAAADSPTRSAATEQVARYWLAFVRTGDPAVVGQARWPEVAVDGEPTTAMLEITPDGAVTHGTDPWEDRLLALARLVVP